MSLLSLVSDPLDFFRPSIILDQHFGMGLDDEDFLEPCVPRRLRRTLLTAPYTRNWRSQVATRDKGSNLQIDKNKFQVSLDVQQFTPEEITVKASGDNNTITVEGKHEEKQDEHGLISRHFVRKYILPEGHDINQVQSKLSTDGVLTITAPKIQKGKEVEREIPITITGQPTASIQVSSDEKKEEKCEIKKK